MKTAPRRDQEDRGARQPGVRFDGPVVGIASGSPTHGVSTHDADTYADGHRRVTAHVVRVLRTPVAAARAAALPAMVVEVVWAGQGGRTHTGRAVTTSGHRAGDRLVLWADASGEVTPGPPPAAMVVVVALPAGPAAAGGLWGGLWTAAHLVRSGRRVWTARRAVTGWEGEWRSIAAGGR